MKNFLLPCMILISGFCTSQVGINTPIPKATLDVEGQPTSPTTIDGLIPPRLTGDQLKAKDNVYLANQTGSIVYVTAATNSPSTKTINVTAIGYYYFDGTLWKSLVTPTSGGTVVGYSALVYGNSVAWTADNTVTTFDISQGSGSLASWRTNSTTLTVPANQGGTYIISYTAGLLINGNVPTTYSFMAFPTKNGVQIGNRSTTAVPGGAGTNYNNETVSNTWSVIVNLVPGDQIQMKGFTYTASGTPTSFRVVRLSLEKVN
ncbi:hypothetical protein [Chryseobacterium sediminis]|uniref:Uncharacterized protein n=1 Tax=Chryseobacterium indologenes TaxID=253 RepID=A0A411DHA6_CHRID|nr:hypothetical protein [Chryseobacterium sediminis]MDR6462662.1 hypothetical protein [Chryseobacterium sediminis]QBA19720.1 hypothetical protein EU348_00475 [Chryseobacterium indologenes]